MSSANRIPNDGQPHAKKWRPFKAATKGKHGPDRFVAEVLSLRGGKQANFLCLQRMSDGSYIEALLSKKRPAPKVGDMVMVQGEFEERQETERNQETFRLRIKFMTCLGRPSARCKASHDALQDALAGHVPVKATRTIRRPVVVTGQETAGERDIRATLKGAEMLNLGFPQFEYVDLSSPESIAEGVRQAARVPDVHAVILARGGASAPQHLLPFSHPAVIRAVAEVAKCVPVIVGIGHAGDHPLCERVASYAAITPTAAGEQILKLNRARDEQLRRAAAERAQARLIRETRARERPALVQAPHAPESAEPKAPRKAAWLRRGWKTMLASIVLVALMSAGIQVLARMMFEEHVAPPAPQAPTIAGAPTAPVPPVKTAPARRKRQKPLKNAVAPSSATADAGTEWPPAAEEAPQALMQIGVFQ